MLESCVLCLDSGWLKSNPYYFRNSYDFLGNPYDFLRDSYDFLRDSYDFLRNSYDFPMDSSQNLSRTAPGPSSMDPSQYFVKMALIFFSLALQGSYHEPNVFFPGNLYLAAPTVCSLHYQFFCVLQSLWFSSSGSPDSSWNAYQFSSF